MTTSYPKDPQIVPYPLETLKCSHALKIRTCADFFDWMTNLLRRGGILKLPGGMALFVGLWGMFKVMSKARNQTASVALHWSRNPGGHKMIWDIFASSANLPINLQLAQIYTEKKDENSTFSWIKRMYINIYLLWGKLNKILG